MERAGSLTGDDAGGSWACPAGVLGTVRESYTAPPEIVVGAPDHLRELTHVNAGLSAPLLARSVKWKHEGFDEQGWLLLPLNVKGKLPMVTIVHGGPASAAQPYYYGPSLQQAMLERGWAVFRPNPRGSFGQGERSRSPMSVISAMATCATSWPASMPPSASPQSMKNGWDSPAEATVGS